MITFRAFHAFFVFGGILGLTMTAEASPIVRHFSCLSRADDAPYRIELEESLTRGYNLSLSRTDGVEVVKYQDGVIDFDQPYLSDNWLTMVRSQSILSVHKNGDAWTGTYQNTAPILISADRLDVAVDPALKEGVEVRCEPIAEEQIFFACGALTILRDPFHQSFAIIDGATRLAEPIRAGSYNRTMLHLTNSRVPAVVGTRDRTYPMNNWFLTFKFFDTNHAIQETRHTCTMSEYD